MQGFTLIMFRPFYRDILHRSISAMHYILALYSYGTCDTYKSTTITSYFIYSGYEDTSKAISVCEQVLAI